MKMKLLPILLVALLFGVQNISAQAVETQIAKIRAQVAVINKSAAKYKKKTKNLEDVSTEGGEATFYSQGAALNKTVAKIYGETGNTVVEVYYDGNVPVFIYQKMSRYSRPLGAGNMQPKVSSVEETRVYYVNEQIVRILVGKQEIKAGDEKFEEIKKDFSDFSDKLFETFKK